MRVSAMVRGLTGLMGFLGLVVCPSMAFAGDKVDRDPIEVAVKGGRITVSEEEAHTTEHHKAVLWKLTSPGYAFTKDGIVIDSKGKHRCKVVDQGRGFRCDKQGHVKGAKYKYVVKLKPVGDSPAVSPLDPWVVND